MGSIVHLLPSDKAEQLGNSHGECGDVGDEEQGNSDNCKEGQQHLDNLLDLDAVDAAACEEDSADRGSQGADTQVHDHHETEVDSVHAPGLDDGQEDGGEDQNCGGGVHEAAHNQQNQVHDEKDDVLVGGQAKDGFCNHLGDMGVAHDVAHDAGHADKVLNDSGGLDGGEDDAGQVLDSDISVDEGEDQSVGNCDSGAFGSGEDTAEDTADNNNDHQKAGDTVPQGLQGVFEGVVLLGGVAALLGHNACNDHNSKTPEDAGDVACHEQSCNRNGACHGGVDDHDVGGGDHHTGRAGSDVTNSDVLVGVACFLLHGAKDAAHGDSSGNARTGHCAEEHVCNDVGLCKGAGKSVSDDLGTADQTPCNAA